MMNEVDVGRRAVVLGLLAMPWVAGVAATEPASETMFQWRWLYEDGGLSGLHFRAPGGAVSQATMDAAVVKWLGEERKRPVVLRDGAPVLVRHGDFMASILPGDRVETERLCNDGMIREWIAEAQTRHYDRLGVCLVQWRLGSALESGVLRMNTDFVPASEATMDDAFVAFREIALANFGQSGPRSGEVIVAQQPGPRVETFREYAGSGLANEVLARTYLRTGKAPAAWTPPAA